MGTCNRSVCLAPLNGAVAQEAHSGNESDFCLPGSERWCSLGLWKAKVERVGVNILHNGCWWERSKSPVVLECRCGFTDLCWVQGHHWEQQVKLCFQLWWINTARSSLILSWHIILRHSTVLVTPSICYHEERPCWCASFPFCCACSWSSCTNQRWCV